MPNPPLSSVTRRTALKLTAASASLIACGRNSDTTCKHVGVIGGGIIGASIAYHLAKAGIDVTLCERGNLAERASRGTFAWINATWAKQPRHYHQLSQQGVASWAQLQNALNIPVRWGGSLEWFSTQTRQALLAEQIAEQVEWDEPASMLNGEALQALEPNVVFDSTKDVAFSPNDGAVDPVFATQALARATMTLGATIKTNCAVTVATSLKDGKTRLDTSCGSLVVDQYVLATGAAPNITTQLAGIDIPQRTTPGVIVMTKPMRPLINRIIVAPGVHIHQRDDGRIVLGEQDGAPETAAHAAQLRGRPNVFPNPALAQQHGVRILSIAEKFVPGIIEAEIENAYIGWRPLPLDGHPVLGASPARPSAYLAITHSGVTLAPVIGALAAHEIATGMPAPNLDHYRPGRNFNEIRRY